MPTNSLDPAQDNFGPGGRLSHSSRWGHGLCPRAWFYQREWGWKGEAIPVLVFGHAVEETVCRILKESPSLVMANAVSNAFDSPTRQEAAFWRRRDRINTVIDQRDDAAWKGPLLLPTNDDFSNIDDLRQWAYARIETHWARALTTAHETWLADANRSGDWEEFMASRGNSGPDLIRHAIDLHLQEIENCLAAKGGPTLANFRSGNRPSIPAPDGFPAEYNGIHPCAQKQGDPSLLEAWEIVRPWFVDPDAGKFTQQAILPDGWFQGEYDLVYRWEGSPRIVDLKASNGTSEWAASYPVQMQTYAWLWWASHGKEEMVSGLETWYLGAGKRKTYSLPTADEMTEFEVELHEFWQTYVSTKGKRDIADYPPKPAPVPRFSVAGGEKISEEEPSVRCGQCYWAGECEASGQYRPHNNASEYFDHDGSTYLLTAVDKLEARISVEGRVGTWKPNPWKFGGIAPALSLFIDSTSLWCSPYKGGPISIPEGVRGGSNIRIDNGYLAPTRKGGVQLKLDEETFFTIIESDNFQGLPAPMALPRVNIRGRVMSLSAGEGETEWGKWKRWGAELMTAEGPIEITAMSENIPFVHDEVERGDEVVVLGGYATAFATKKQVAFDGQTILRIL